MPAGSQKCGYTKIKKVNMKFDLNKLLRENIKKMSAYSSARNEYKGKSGIFLDANENPFKQQKFLYQEINRYPDPLQLKLKAKIGTLKKTDPENIFIGNGSDEAIDILFRAFCEPAKDNVIICPPTYGMYEVTANINNVKVKKIPLTKEKFQLNPEGILKSIDSNTKLIFICCPNNPTGNGVKSKDIQKLLNSFTGIVVVDEAYIDFASYKSLITELNNYTNLVILQTFSKAWGLAGIRVGLSFASKEIIAVFNKIKPPYNINTISQNIAYKALQNKKTITSQVNEIISERKKLANALSKIHCITKVFPSEANFILVKTTNANDIYKYLVNQKIIVRNRSNIILCDNCLRITVGTKKENKLLLNKLSAYSL